MTFFLWLGLVTGRLIWIFLNVFLLFVYFKVSRKTRIFFWLKIALVLSCSSWALFCLALNPYRDWHKADLIARLLTEAHHPALSSPLSNMSTCTDDGRIKITQWRVLSRRTEFPLRAFYQQHNELIEVSDIYASNSFVVQARIPEGSVWVRDLPWNLSWVMSSPFEPERSSGFKGKLSRFPIPEVYYDISLVEAESGFRDLRCVLDAQAEWLPWTGPF